MVNSLDEKLIDVKPDKSNKFYERISDDDPAIAKGLKELYEIFDRICGTTPKYSFK
ncbi:MAG: hypothetical protein WC376_04870 [Candidatus Nanoarchaeia archaeon]|jgi:hypothetical protein